MPRFIRNSSRPTRRLVAALALATTAAVPALTIIGGQAPASVAAVKVSPLSVNWR
ncbi:MAG: hypothetical protein QOF28_2959 [Actinomycetota bacterium]|nr:hypothetical protein [Actinomycetota bacterium]